MKILVAEDNVFYSIMLETTLRGWGYEVIAARDGEEAWRVLCADDPPSLAIVDWMMPGLDGLELCGRIRAAAQGQPTYIVLLTVKGGKENIVTGLKAGADDYISKPFDIEELRTRIQTGKRIVELQASLAARVKELEHALSGVPLREPLGGPADGVAVNGLFTGIVGGVETLLGELREDGPRALAETILQSAQLGAALTGQLLAREERPSPLERLPCQDADNPSLYDVFSCQGRESCEF